MVMYPGRAVVTHSVRSQSVLHGPLISGKSSRTELELAR